MRIFLLYIFISLMSLLLSSCADFPSSSALPSSFALSSKFSTDNIMKLHQGMSSDEILTLFGEPKKVRVAVCGRSPDQWTCTTWEYGQPPYDSASFTFNGEHDSLKLNNFNVDRK